MLGLLTTGSTATAALSASDKWENGR